MFSSSAMALPDGASVTRLNEEVKSGLRGRAGWRSENKKITPTCPAITSEIVAHQRNRDQAQGSGPFAFIAIHSFARPPLADSSPEGFPLIQPRAPVSPVE